MPDDLRTRIAKALYGQLQIPVEPFDEQPSVVQAAWLDDADAVIRELGLTAEYDYGTTYPHPPVTDQRFVRYVTRWFADDTPHDWNPSHVRF